MKCLCFGWFSVGRNFSYPFFSRADRKERSFFINESRMDEESGRHGERQKTREEMRGTALPSQKKIFLRIHHPAESYWGKICNFGDSKHNYVLPDCSGKFIERQSFHHIVGILSSSASPVVVDKAQNGRNLFRHTNEAPISNHYDDFHESQARTHTLTQIEYKTRLRIASRHFGRWILSH